MRSVKMIVHVSRTLGRVVRDYARLQDASVSEAIRGGRRGRSRRVG